MSIIFILLSAGMGIVDIPHAQWKPTVFVLMTCISCVHCAFLLGLGTGLMMGRDVPEAGIRRFCPSLFVSLGLALLALLMAVFVVWFDVRFNTDVLHFMTNAAPANQMLHAGGVPLIDTFSQYGQGPMLMTWLVFVLIEPNLHAANIMAQLHSMALHGCVLICMYRITRHKLAALWLGFFAIGVRLSGWWYGNHSLNSVPSSMGLRYLPCALVALSISLLNRDRQVSWLLNLSMMLCALWSTEILMAGVAITGLFLCPECARRPDIYRIGRSVVLVLVLPIAQAAMALSTMTYLAGGQLPDLRPLVDFLQVYNMTSEFWSIAASGQFFGWVAVAAASGLTLPHDP